MKEYNDGVLTVPAYAGAARAGGKNVFFYAVLSSVGCAAAAHFAPI